MTAKEKMNSNKMTDRIADISLRKAALVAGIGLLFMTILAFPADYLVNQSVIVPGDAEATAKNIMANELLFRVGIVSFIVVAVLDVVVAWALYAFLKPVNKILSLFAGWFRLVYAVILAIALNNLFNVLHLLSGAEYLAEFETGQLHAQVMLFLNAFSYGWVIGLLFFSLSFFILGYLVMKSDYIPKIIGILLIITPIGYLIDCFGDFLLSDYNANIKMFTFIGELVFMFWLLIKGGKVSTAR